MRMLLGRNSPLTTPDPNALRSPGFDEADYINNFLASTCFHSPSRVLTRVRRIPHV